MSSSSQRPVGHRSVVTIFYFLAIGSGIARTISVAFDYIALNTVLSDPVIYGVLSQWVSFFVTVLAVALLSLKRKKNGATRSLGYELDPDFGRIRRLPKTPMIYLVFSGIFAGISTFFYYILIGATDASAVLPYGQLVIIYLLFGDLLADKDTPTIIEIQCIISIMFGVLLVGVEPGGFNLVTIFIVLVPMNISSAFSTYYQRKTKRHELQPGLKVDSLNMRVWSLLVLNIVMTMLAIPFLPSNTLDIMASTFVPLFWLMMGSSISIFLGLVMYVRALGKGSMAVVNSLSSISVILGIPLTFVGNFFIEGAFGQLTDDPFLWILKFFGIALIMIGVIALEAADVRSLVLIRVKPHTGDILPSLFDIKGVEKASGMAGDYDYMLSIKSRSLGKTRTNILKKVQAIPSVQHIETLVVLRDYR
ncbi:MAG: Lrp/AsnC ligand binding domain-containing protein [Candidatus Thorarchaeota archaeon]